MVSRSELVYIYEDDNDVVEDEEDEEDDVEDEEDVNDDQDVGGRW